MMLPSEMQENLHEIIFGTDTKAGKAFDVALLFAIIGSVLAVMLESVTEIRENWGAELRIVEWAFTLIFTGEYLLRLMITRRPLRYAYSFFGVVDLLSIVPTYLSLFLPGTQTFIVIRALRLLRVFRVFKLARFLGEANVLMTALRMSRDKVIVFMATVLILVSILGSMMYLVEGSESGFTSIPRSIYWAIVTMTTVGYGDIAPVTVSGQTLAAIVMILGYSIIAVPTGIVSAEMIEASRGSRNLRCEHCRSPHHDHDAIFCKRCGSPLETVMTKE